MKQKHKLYGFYLIRQAFVLYLTMRVTRTRQFWFLIHAFIIRTEYKDNIFVPSALVDMNSKCRSIKSAETNHPGFLSQSRNAPTQLIMSTSYPSYMSPTQRDAHFLASQLTCFIINVNSLCSKMVFDVLGCWGELLQVYRKDIFDSVDINDNFQVDGDDHINTYNVNNIYDDFDNDKICYSSVCRVTNRATHFGV